MRLETKRLRLREYYKHEADKLVALANHWEIAEWMVGLPYPYAHQDAVKWIEEVWARHDRGNPLSFAFALKDTDELIGGGGLDGTFGGKLEQPAIGYWFGLPHQGKGYGTEVLGALIAYGFDALGFDAVYATTDPDNIRSQKALMKAGLKFIEMMKIDGNRRHSGATVVPAYRITREEFIRQ